MKAYNKSLKDQGYDVPEDMYGGGEQKQEAPRYMTQQELQESMRKTAPDLISLTAVSNEYQHYYGTPYTAIEQDFAEAQKAGKPLTQYARQKYNFEGKKNEMAAAADQKRIDALVEERVKAREAELVASHGSNANTRTPVPSKFDRLEKSGLTPKDSWKSAKGRAENRINRVERFEKAGGIPIQ